jgi:hypothetical protein
VRALSRELTAEVRLNDGSSNWNFTLANCEIRYRTEVNMLNEISNSNVKKKWNEPIEVNILKHILLRS